MLMCMLEYTFWFHAGVFVIAHWCTGVCVYVYVCVCVCGCVCVLPGAYMYRSVYVCIYIQVCVRARAPMRVCASFVCVYLYASV